MSDVHLIEGALKGELILCLSSLEIFNMTIRHLMKILLSELCSVVDSHSIVS